MPLLVVAVVLLTGCSWSYKFRLLLTVKNADDGTPVQGVTAVLDDPVLADERKQDLNAGSRLGTTDAGGELTHDFIRNGSGWSDPWYLKLKKEGFEPQVIDINPRKDGLKSGEPNPLPIAVEMKPLPKKP